jgi:IS5 family transposase
VVDDERAVYADKAYEKRERRAALKARGVKDASSIGATSI